LSAKNGQEFVHLSLLMASNDEIKVKSFLEKARGQKLDVLDLSGLGIQSLPEKLLDVAPFVHHIKLGTSRTFTLAGHHKNTIEDFRLLQHFRNVKKLTLSSLRIQHVSQISFLYQVEELDLDNNELYNLEGIEKLSQLKVLNVSGNHLTRIDELAALSGLRDLNLSRNLSFNLRVLHKLPNLNTLSLAQSLYHASDLGNLGEMESLQQLDVSGNQIDDLYQLSQLKRLTKLAAANNHIQFLHPLTDLSKLQDLDLSNNRISDLEPLLKLKDLQKLNLKDNDIYNIAPLKKLKGLEQLNLAGNKLSSISPLSQLIKLKELNLDRCGIANNIYVLGRLSNLTSLSLANNRIIDIRALKLLKKIEYLNLRKNEISDISPLKELLKGKKDSFKVMYEEIRRIGWKQNGIFLSDNPIINPPKQYLNAGPKAILSYWDQQEKKAFTLERKIAVSEAKLIIVGNSNVGKSTLSYLLRNKQLPAQDINSTHGLEFAAWQPNWKIDGHQLIVNVIDFGGQEYYHDTHHLFFNNRAVYLVLWDHATNQNVKLDTPVGGRESSALIRHFNVEYWLTAIKIYSGSDSQAKTPVLLVQTHVDLHGTIFLNMKDIKGRHPQLAGSAAVIMDTKNFHFSGIDLLEMQIRQQLEASSENFSQEYFESWLRIRKHIEEKEKGKFHILSIQEFKNYFEKYSGASAKYSIKDIQTLCITLDYWGAILYKYAIDDLKNIVVINPQQFSSRVNSLLTEDIRQKNGVFTEQAVKTVLNADAGKTESFINILKIFKIIFELPKARQADQQLYISPMYLHEKPAYIGLLLSNFITYHKIRYKGYFHKGILLDCFSKLGKELYFEKGLYFYWQWGLVLKRGDRIISIEFDESNLDQVRISTIRQGNELLGQDSFLQDILAAFSEINEDYEDDVEISSDGKDFISKAFLLEEMRHGLNKIVYNDKSFHAKDFYFLLKNEEISKPIKRIFVSYSSKDRAYLDQLSAHLELYRKAGLIDHWNDLMLSSREEWNSQIEDEMNRANIIIMLLSPDYFATSYILEKEIPIAISCLEAPSKRKQIYWVLLRPCSYDVFPEVAKYPIFPLKEKEASSGMARQKAISEHPNQDREWVKLLTMILVQGD